MRTITSLGEYEAALNEVRAMGVQVGYLDQHIVNLERELRHGTRPAYEISNDVTVMKSARSRLVQRYNRSVRLAATARGTVPWELVR